MQREYSQSIADSLLQSIVKRDRQEAELATGRPIPNNPTGGDMTKSVLKSCASVATLAILSLSAAPAFAQAAAAPAAEEDASGLNEIVVTAAAGDKTQLNSSVSVTSINAALIEDFKPSSEAEIFRMIPGIQVGGTAGPAGNANIAVRGLPVATGGSPFVQIQEDGLPTRFVNVDDAGTRYHPLYRYPAIALPQPGQHRILNRIERRIINMSALCSRHVIAPRFAQNMRDAKPGAGAKHADRAFIRQRHIRPAQGNEMAGLSLGDRMAHRFKIIDQYVMINTQLFINQGGADDPWVVGEFNHLVFFAFGRNRPGNGDGSGFGQSCPAYPSKLLPRCLKTSVFRRFERCFRAQIRNAPIRHFGQRKAGMGAANINRNKFHRVVQTPDWLILEPILTLFAVAA